MVNVTATPKSNCGWVFNSFVVYLENGRYWAAFYNNPLTRIPRSISREEGETLPLKIVASFTFSGAGKLMRSSQQPGKLVRDGDKLIIDR